MACWKVQICTEPVLLDGYYLCLKFMRNPNGLWDFHNILRDQHLVKPSAFKIILELNVLKTLDQKRSFKGKEIALPVPASFLIQFVFTMYSD